MLSNTTRAFVLVVAAYALCGCPARSVEEVAPTRGTDAAEDSSADNSSSGEPEPVATASSSGSGSSSSTGEDLGPDDCPERTLDMPATLSVVGIEVDRDGPEPFPEVRPHTWSCVATGLVEASMISNPSLELECLDPVSGETWRQALFFLTEWPLELASELVGEEDLRLEYFAQWRGFSIGPVRYSLHDANGELLLWVTSYGKICDFALVSGEECNLAFVPLDEPIAPPTPFASIMPVDDGCGLRRSSDGDFYPNHSTGYVPPEVVHRHAIRLDDDDATVVHDGRSARVTKDGATFDVFVSSAHVAVHPSPDSYVSNASIMLVRVP